MIVRVRFCTTLAVLAVALALTGRATTGAESVETGIKHVVLCWLEEPGNAEHRRRVSEVSRELVMIPEVRDMAVGTAVPSERPIVEDTFDIGLVMTFRDEAALNTYLEHPEHVRRVQDTLGPLCARVQVLDIRY